LRKTNYPDLALDFVFVAFALWISDDACCRGAAWFVTMSGPKAAALHAMPHLKCRVVYKSHQTVPESVVSSRGESFTMDRWLYNFKKVLSLV
jgi:hypothetical protein